MSLETVENDFFRDTLCFGNISLSPKVMELDEEKLINLFGKIQNFLAWRKEAIETHSFGILEVERKRYLFSISKEGNCKILNVRRVGEFS